MNGPGDIPLAHSTTPDTRPCSLVSIIPTLGMSSCRGRAEAFARRLSSKLRTLGSQNDEEALTPEDEPIINGSGTTKNTWITSPDAERTVTDLQPLRNESDSFFDFDCELESPGSPVDECEYLRLIETASNTPHNSVAESGYACASAASSHSSTDGAAFLNACHKEDMSNSSSFAAAGIILEHDEELLVTASATTQMADNNRNANALKMNGSHEALSNGFNNHYEEKERDLKQKQDIDETDACAQARTCTTLMLQSDMVSVQEKIINELQKQSELYAQANRLESESAEENSKPKEKENETATATNEVEEKEVKENANESQIPASTHAVTNGISNEKLNKNELTEAAVASCETAENLVKVEEIHEEKKASEEDETLNSKRKAQQQHTNLSGNDTTDDEDECRPQRVRRCSSLKTGKTPPGTPGRKKIVRFADVLGLDLADIKTFLDEIPTIPKSAFEDLEVLDSEPPIQLGPKSDKMLMPLFQQPGGLTNFLDLVREKQVSLENAAVTDHINQTITGSVRVRNLDFHKSVHIRYTLDGWRSFADLQANYVENSCDGFSDKFTFTLFGNSLHIGQRLELAVRFQCKGQQFWDNNYGTNYCFQCLPTAGPAALNHAPTPLLTRPQTHHHTTNQHHHGGLHGMLSPTASDAWCTSFY